MTEINVSGGRVANYYAMVAQVKDQKLSIGKNGYTLNGNTIEDGGALSDLVDRYIRTWTSNIQDKNVEYHDGNFEGYKYHAFVFVGHDKNRIGLTEDGFEHNGKLIHDINESYKIFFDFIKKELDS